MLPNFLSSPWKSAKKNQLPMENQQEYQLPLSRTKSFPYDRYMPSKVSSDIFDFHLIKEKSSSLTNLDQKEDPNLVETETLSSDGNLNSNTNEILREDLNMLNYATLLEKNIINLEEKKNCKTSNTFSDAPILKYNKSYHEAKKDTQFLSYNSFNNNFHSYIDFPKENLTLNSIRKISSYAYKILDAPNLQDDFYLNVLDWSKQNLIAVGLENTLYTWSPITNQTTKIIELGNDVSLISSVSFNNSNYLSMGESNGTVRIFDIETSKQVYYIKNHAGRVSTITWNDNLITTGSRDKRINIMDSRYINNHSKKSLLFSLNGHTQEVCGTKWSFDYETLASGGNDNKVFLWNLKMPKKHIAHFSEHKAAVKALAWSPHQYNILASGGGTNDKTIKFWNTRTMTCTKNIEVGSQVCNMAFSQNVNELVSTHGFLLNQIFVWKYPEMKKIATLSGHKQRILYLAMSPDGEDIVTGAGDDTIRFWKVFPKKPTYSFENKDNQMDFQLELR